MPSGVLEKGNARTIKEQNLRLVLDIVRRSGPISRSELAKATGISAPSVSHIVATLEQLGWIVAQGFGRSTGGRPAVKYAFNTRAGRVLAVDLGGTTLRCAVADLSGAIADARETPSHAKAGREAVLTALFSAVEDILTATSKGQGPLKAIAVAAPGVVDPRTGVTRLAPNLVGWMNVRLRDLLMERYRVPVAVENDVNVAALGEGQFGAARGKASFAYLTVGTGIGLGIVIDGKVYRGAGGMSGEIGYLTYKTRLRDPVLLDHGHLEAIASGFGIAYQARRLSDAPQGTGELDAKAIFDAASRGDARSGLIVQRAVRALALAVHNVACVLNPEAIVLGGGVIIHQPWICDEIPKILRLLTPFEVPIRLSELGARAGLLGGVSMAVDEVVRHITFA